MTYVMANNYTEYRNFVRDNRAELGLTRFLHCDEKISGMKLKGKVIILNGSLYHGKKADVNINYLEQKELSGDIKIDLIGY